ncbi:hypothetical protein E2C01_047298 [Portunus trituberculatus]|uniref:DDE-1 domain-containing protein n=1 Tax=Portunus trituberculatus TaxID=210409 RepID=A0A5B7G773_PORTR|nr:hypothetical protein [Portunus trituberculatus]
MSGPIHPGVFRLPGCIGPPHFHYVFAKLKLPNVFLDITIIKLPPHITDVLQPLHVCCFKPLKTRWDATIAKWQAANYARKITKEEFVDLVGKVWDECFSLPNIGLYPPDRSVYPVKTFNPDLYKLYKSIQTSSEPVHKPATPKKVTPPREMISPSTSFEQIMADVFFLPWYSGTMCALESEGSTSARVRILSTVRV